MTGPILHLRRELRGLVVLELLQLAAGIGVLVAIAVHAMVIAADTEIAAATAGGVLIAVAYFLLALRVRVGQGLLRGELLAMEHRHGLDLDRERVDSRSHPYRSVCGCGLRPDQRW